MNKTVQPPLDDIAELRRLLVGPELNKLEELADSLQDPETFSSHIGKVLPQAMQKSAAQGQQLSEAMVPTVEEIVQLSIKRDINKFANALFPVIGPAIRKSIAETFRQMMQSMNQVLEYGLSWQGIKWRIESIRSGIPFAQIVLLNSLEFRVEQVFLIHRETGLLLQHLQLEEQHNQNADMVSSMLTAIGDFVGDSFDVSERQELDSIQVGDFSIWIEKSPAAVLAIAIRGNAPNSLRQTLQQTLEQIQTEYALPLDEFKGDIGVFEDASNSMKDCLASGYTQKKEGVSLKTKLVSLAVLILLFYWFAGNAYTHWQQQDYIELLEQEPGIIITRVQRQGDALDIQGLRDPYARNPRQFLALTTLAEDKVRLSFEAFHSTHPPFVRQRLQSVMPHSPNLEADISGHTLILRGYASAEMLRDVRMLAALIPGISSMDAKGVSSSVDLSSLEAPDSVALDLDLDKGLLILAGKAPAAWLDDVRPKLARLQAVRAVDDSGLDVGIDLQRFSPPPGVQLELDAGKLLVSGESDFAWAQSLYRQARDMAEIQTIEDSQLQISELRLMQESIEQLQREHIFFGVANSYTLDSNAVLEQAARLILRILENARVLGRRVDVTVHGFSDSIGSFRDNVTLSLARADHVAQYLVESGIPPRVLTVKGIDEPVTQEKNAAEQDFNRRVSFRVRVD